MTGVFYKQPKRKIKAMKPQSLHIPLPLQPYVKSALWLKRNTEAAFNFNILPRYHPAFIFSLNDTEDIPNHYAGNKIVFKPCNIYFGGGGLIPSRFTIPAKMNVILILLHPQATGVFWQEDALHFFDQPNLISNNGQQLRIVNEKVQESPTIDEKWKHIRAFLTQKLLKKIPYNFLYVQRAVSIINETSGTIDIRQLALRSYTSQRNLLDCFRQYVGATPKQIASMARFNSMAKEYIMNPDTATLNHKIAKYRYHDASHLYKDFNRYLAYTPQQFTAQDNKINMVV